MNRDFSQFVDWIKDKKVAVIGIGISNQPLLKMLADLGLNLSAFDIMEEDSTNAQFLKERFNDAGYKINWYLGENYIDHLQGFDLIFRTPIMMPYQEELLAEKARGAIITSEMEVFMTYCPAHTFAVTGSDGKSTTASLIYSMLKEEGYDTYIGGNIGKPLLNQIAKMTAETKVVLELSSFQLIDLTVSPNVAVLTNLTPNHLNVHQNYKEYKEAKQQIYRHQIISDRIVVNGLSAEFAKDWPNFKSQIIWFNDRFNNCQHPLFKRYKNQLGYCSRDCKNFHSICSIEDLNILGSFNLENTLAAMAAVKDYVSPENIRQAIKKFKGLEHRLEFVREVNGVKYYNSSIDSSPQRSKHSISTFIEAQTPTVLIMGGQDKNSDYKGLGKIIAAATDKLILCGENASLIEQQVLRESHLVGKSRKYIQIEHCKDYRRAVHKASLLAEAGEIVLLTPAGTSFDQFNNFMERGNMFKKLVNTL